MNVCVLVAAGLAMQEMYFCLYMCVQFVYMCAYVCVRLCYVLEVQMCVHVGKCENIGVLWQCVGMCECIHILLILSVCLFYLDVCYLNGSFIMPILL